MAATPPGTIALTRGSTRYLYKLTANNQITIDEGADISQAEAGQQGNVTPLAILDLSGGLGSRAALTKDDVNRYWYSYGWDTRYPNQLQLWPECTLLTTITATDAPPSYNGRMGAVLTARLGTSETYSVFAQYGDRVIEIANPTTSSPTVTERFNHTQRLVNLQLFTDTVAGTPYQLYLLTADEDGTASSWYRSADGITFSSWSPAVGATDAKNANPFIVDGVTGTQINWVQQDTVAHWWQVEQKVTPDTSGATVLSSWKDNNLRPRFLGVAQGVAQYSIPAMRRLTGIAHDVGLEPNNVSSWMNRDVYGYRNLLLFTGTGSSAPEPFLFNVGVRISEVHNMNRGQGIHTSYIGHIGPIASRPDACYFLMEISTSEVLNRNPDGTQTTWLMEMPASSLTFHPIACKVGAMTDFGIAVTTDTVYFQVKTSATTCDVYRVKRGASPGVRGTDNFEPMLPKCAQFTAANSKYLSIADNTVLSMGDVAMDSCCFVYFDTLPAAGNRMGIAGKNSAVKTEYGMYAEADGGGNVKFVFRVRNTADNTETTVTASTFGNLSTATWYFVHWYHDPTTNLIGISVNNGVHDTTATSGGILDSTTAFEVGRFAAGSYMDGRIEALGMWKHATTMLTAAQITAIYNSGNGITFADTDSGTRTNMIAWWDFDETNGTRYDGKGTNNLTDNNTVTQATGKTGGVARLELPWMDFGQPQNQGLIFFFRSLVGTFTNMSLRVKYQLDRDETTDYTAGTLTSAGTITLSANQSFYSMRLILEAWRSTGSTATDTLVLTGGIEMGVKKQAPSRTTYVVPIDLEETRPLRQGAVTRGRLLTELQGHSQQIVSLYYDEGTISNLYVDRIRATEKIDDPNRGRSGKYNIVLKDVAV